MVGVRAGTEETQLLTELPNVLPDAPAKSAIRITKAQLLDGSYEHRVWVSFADNSYQYLGALQPQFGDFPVKTLMLQIRDSRLIVGVVDRRQDPGASHIRIHRSNLDANTNLPISKYGKLNGDPFFIPIQPDEVDEWSRIKFIGVTSSSGLDGLTKLENRPTYLKKEFDPPFAIDGLLIPVDQQLAHKPEQQ
jgi:hypothetical protein